MAAYEKIDDGKNETDKRTEQVRNWFSELEMSKNTESNWFQEAKDIIDNYKIQSKKTDSFNVLTANTEILRQAVYNTPPNADIRRRYRDGDQVGKAVCDVANRATNFEIDYLDADIAFKGAVLDGLLGGRGVVRVSYEPVIVSEPAVSVDGQPVLNPDGTSKMVDRKVSEEAPIKLVPWDRFRRGPGRNWNEVPWIAFGHDLNEQEAAEMFGEEMADKLDYTELQLDTADTSKEKEKTKKFKTALVWEIWCKQSKKVYFLSLCYQDNFLKEPVDDPLKLQGFYPIPRPFYYFENTNDLLPIPPYRAYKQKAQELNLVSARLKKLTAAFKHRGAYNAQFDEIQRALSGNDNDFVPVANAAGLDAAGGIKNNIWTMPLSDLATSITELEGRQRNLLNDIYEITGIGDIMKSTSDPRETATAAKLKTQWGSLRLQRVQREVQRFCRDAIRIKTEIICEHYDAQTLKNITGLAYPDAPIPVPPPMPGAPPPQAPPPDWMSIQKVMKSELMRSYRIEVETDSTIQDTMSVDTAELSMLIKQILEYLTAVGPMVQNGAVPFEVAKEMLLAVVRRAKMGPAIEDLLDDLQPPGPPPEPTEKQLEQIRGAKDQFIKVAAEHTFEVQQEVQKSAALAQAAQEQAYQVEQLHAGMAHAIGQHQVAKASDQALVSAVENLKAMLGETNAETKRLLTEALTSIHKVVSAPKVVSLQKDREGKNIGAVAVPVLGGN